MLPIDITNSHDLHAFIGKKGSQIARALAANADTGETNFAIGRHCSGSTEDGSRKDEWNRGLEKLAA
jgi:hypothetical protein